MAAVASTVAAALRALTRCTARLVFTPIIARTLRDFTNPEFASLVTPHTGAAP